MPALRRLWCRVSSSSWVVQMPPVPFSLDPYARSINKLRSEYAPDGTPLTMKPPEVEPVDLILHPKSLVFLRSNLFREAVYWLLGIVTAGLFFLLCRWLPTVEASVRYTTVRMLVYLCLS